MSRDLPPALEAEIEKSELKPFLALRLALNVPLHLWTGRGSITFSDADGVSRDWSGVGDLGAFDTIGEATDGSATGVRVALLKAPGELHAEISAGIDRGALMEVYFGALDETYQQVVGSALIWKGRVDQYKITDAGATLSVELTGESRSIDQRRPAVKRFSSEMQQRKHPGDKFFEYLPQMTEFTVLWGRAELSGAAVGGGGSGGVSGGIGQYTSINHH